MSCFNLNASIWGCSSRLDELEGDEFGAPPDVLGWAPPLAASRDLTRLLAKSTKFPFGYFLRYASKSFCSLLFSIDSQNFSSIEETSAASPGASRRSRGLGSLSPRSLT